LTEREVAVLKLVATGYRYAEIAERLFISQHTVVAHIKNIYQKLAVNSRSAAVYEAQRRAILPPVQRLSR
jgi:DNA-binding CsgD family transcriptional regulator